MSQEKDNGKSTTKTLKKDNDSIVIEFGNRKISNQNSSKIVALPKIALANCCSGKADEVNIQLVQQNGEQFLKLIPLCSAKDGKK